MKILTIAASVCIQPRISFPATPVTERSSAETTPVVTVRSSPNGYQDVYVVQTIKGIEFHVDEGNGLYKLKLNNTYVTNGYEPLTYKKIGRRSQG